MKFKLFKNINRGLEKIHVICDMDQVKYPDIIETWKSNGTEESAHWLYVHIASFVDEKIAETFLKNISGF